MQQIRGSGSVQPPNSIDGDEGSNGVKQEESRLFAATTHAPTIHIYKRRPRQSHVVDTSFKEPRTEQRLQDEYPLPIHHKQGYQNDAPQTYASPTHHERHRQGNIPAHHGQHPQVNPQIYPYSAPAVTNPETRNMPNLSNPISSERTQFYQQPTPQKKWFMVRHHYNPNVTETFERALDRFNRALKNWGKSDNDIRGLAIYVMKYATADGELAVSMLDKIVKANVPLDCGIITSAIESCLRTEQYQHVSAIDTFITNARILPDQKLNQVWTEYTQFAREHEFNI